MMKNTVRFDRRSVTITRKYCVSKMPLSKYTVAELKIKARQRRVPGWSKMKKSELVASLERLNKRSRSPAKRSRSPAKRSRSPAKRSPKRSLSKRMPPPMSPMKSPSRGITCGRAGGRNIDSFPVNTRNQARSALAYARYAPDQKGLTKCVLARSRRMGWHVGSNSAVVRRYKLKPT